MQPRSLNVNDNNDTSNAHNDGTAHDDGHDYSHHLSVEDGNDKTNDPPGTSTSTSTHPEIIICGAGIVGLILALALHKRGLADRQNITVYDKVHEFHEDVGAGMGLYPNGLRVIRDLSPTLLKKIQRAGYPFQLRRWERHDGTEIAVAEDSTLSGEDRDLESIGIRRSRLLEVLYEAVQEAGIPVHLGERVIKVDQVASSFHSYYTDKNDNDCIKDSGSVSSASTASSSVPPCSSSSPYHRVKVTFASGAVHTADIVFGADGTHSQIRNILFPSSKVQYTGVTCLMGMADLARDVRGICFPSSLSTQCHASYFPTGPDEQCFQIHIPTDARSANAEPDGWGTLDHAVSQDECARMATRMRTDGWDEGYIEPLGLVTHAVRVGFCTLSPPLTSWVSQERNIVLVGDACHVPVPYTGMGAQMGLEDVGVLSMLMENLCLNDDGDFDMSKFGPTMKLYERMRIPRVQEINDISKNWGVMQQKRATSQRLSRRAEEEIRRDVFFNLTMSNLFPGVEYDYRSEVFHELKHVAMDGGF